MGSQCFESVRSTMSSLLRSTQRLILMNQNRNVAQMRPMSGGHDPDSYKWWKKVFFFVATPVIILGNINAFVLADPSEMDPPPFVPYDHLRIRTKKFPWGDGNHSLIHNPHTNALPDGFEEDH